MHLKRITAKNKRTTDPQKEQSVEQEEYDKFIDRMRKTVRLL